MDINIIFKIIYSIVGLLLLYTVEKIFIGIKFIGPNEIGIVEKWWSPIGKLKEGNFIALNGEAGYQADILRTGLQFKPALFYKIKKVPLVTIAQGQIAYVYSRDGQALKEGQRLGKKVECNNFQNIREFFANGGQKGTQLTILREGVYPINLANFVIFTSSQNYYLNMGNKLEEQEILKISQELHSIDAFKPVVIEGQKDMVGIVTVHEGPSLSDQIIAPIVGNDPTNKETYHSNFQNPTVFLEAGGFAGRQLQVLTESTYYLNRKFCSIEFIPKTVIPIGFVGVVNSFVGADGKDLSGDDYSHGELVEDGCKGVREKTLGPGKYAINTYAMAISQVPTTNFILKWVDGEIGGHKFDENLSSINLITKDAFQPTLPLSVVVNIGYKTAPYVVQRFGDIKKLVEQTLDPMCQSYFKNIGQTHELISLLQNRTSIQEQATREMREKFKVYNLELIEVLIGTPSSVNDPKIDALLLQLSDRQLAKEQVATYEAKMISAEKEKELREVEAKAKQQSLVTESQINIQVQENQGTAEYHRALKDADKLRAISEAEAFKVITLANADAQKEAKVGIAKSLATQELVNAYGGAQYQVIQDIMTKIATAIEKSGVPIVPQNVVTNGSSESGYPNALESLLGLILSEKLGASFSKNKETSISEYQDTINKIKNEILDSLKDEPQK